MDGRRGLTLVELLVAMVLAGLVGTMVFQWLSHSYRVSSASQHRDDREQILSLARSGLFQDGTRGMLVAVRRDGLAFAIRHEGGTDTVEWSISSAGLLRSGKPMLGRDSVVSWEVVPSLPGLDQGSDPWASLDADLDGAVDRQELGKVGPVDIRLELSHEGFSGGERQRDTVHLVAPARGPG